MARYTLVLFFVFSTLAKTDVAKAEPALQKDIPVFTDMQQTLDWFSAKETELPSRDRRGLFLRIYHEVTLEMVNMFEQNKFQNPDWVRSLMFEYLSLYRNALECDQSRLCEVSPAWQKAFRENKRRKFRPSVQLLLSISAHVNRDLAVALSHIDVEFSSSSEYRDFQTISLIFRRRMPQLIRIVQKYENCHVSSLERKEVNAMINWVMSRTRKQAWDLGRRFSRVKTAKAEKHMIQELEYHAAKQDRTIELFGPLPSRIVCF